MAPFPAAETGRAPGETGWHTGIDRFRGIDRELVLLVLLFVCLRLAAALFLQAGGNLFDGSADLRFYRSIGELSLEGNYPYLDYWMEYPPLFPWLIVGVYWLSFLLPSWPNNLLWFQVAFSALLTCFDAGNLVLVYKLAGALHGPRLARRAAWMYGLLFLPLFAILSWFDTIALFFLLLAVWLGLRQRPGWAGAMAGIGFLVKIFPILAVPLGLLGVARLPQRARYVAGLGLAIGAVVGPLALANSTMLVASARFMVGRASWETIWALLEGYGGTGRVPLLASRFDPRLADWQLHPARLPWLAMTMVFLVLCLMLYSRRLDWSAPRVAIPAAALTLSLFLLFSKGYSPQFLVYPLAFLVIVWPGGWGAAWAVLLTANNLIEWPWAFGFFADDPRLLWLVVITRTALLAWLAVEYAGRLDVVPAGIWPRLKRRLRPLVGAVATLAIAAGGALAVGHYVAPTRPDDAAALSRYLAAFATRDQAAIALTRDGLYQVRPRVPIGVWTVIESDEGQWPASVDERVGDLREGRSRVWLILDQAGPNVGEGDTLARSMDAWGSRATDAWFGRYHLLGYVSSAVPGGSTSLAVPDVFGGTLALQGYDLSARQVVPGQGLSLGLTLASRAPVGTNYKAFVHLLNSTGRIVTQRDRPLARGGAGTAAWPVGQLDREGYDLLVPGNAPCGTYTVEAGLYDPTSGTRLRLTAGPRPGDDKVLLGQVRVCA